MVDHARIRIEFREERHSYKMQVVKAKGAALTEGILTKDKF